MAGAKLRERSDIEIKLVISAGMSALRKGEADFAIVGGRAAPTEFPSVRLAALDGVVVSAPILCDGRAPPNTLDDISDYERLDVTTPPGVWRHWFTAVGRPTPDGRSSRPFDSLHLMYESAAAGLGVALAVPMASERFLVDGRLRACLPDRASVGASYELASRAPELARRSTVKRFKTWLFEEAAASVRLFDERCAIPSPARGRRARDPRT